MGALRRQLIRGPLPSLAFALLVPTALRADARFETSASLRADTDASVVELRLTNAGDTSARDVFVEAELSGLRSEADLGSLGSGEARSCTLRFPGRARPGRHALVVLIDYRPVLPPDAAARKQPSLLLLDLGSAPAPVLSLRLEPSPLDVASDTWVVMRSLDGAAHRVALRLLPPAGVNVLEAPSEVALPATGSARVRARLVRGDAPRGSRHPIAAAATPIGEPLERAAVASAELEILPDPARLPRLRPWLFALGGLLLAGALAAELLLRRAPSG